MVSSGWCVVIKLTARDRDFYTLGICVQLKNFWSGSYTITALFATSEKMNWEVEDKWLEPIEKTWSPYVLYSNLPCRLSALCACVLSCFSHAQFFVTLRRVSTRHRCPWDSPGKNTEAMPSSKGSSRPRNQTWVSYISCIGRCFCFCFPFLPRVPSLSKALLAWLLYITRSLEVEDSAAALFFVFLYSDHLTYQIPASSLIFRDISAVLELPPFYASLWCGALNKSFPGIFVRVLQRNRTNGRYVWVYVCVCYIYIHM